MEFKDLSFLDSIRGLKIFSFVFHCVVHSYFLLLFDSLWCNSLPTSIPMRLNIFQMDIRSSETSSNNRTNYTVRTKITERRGKKRKMARILSRNWTRCCGRRRRRPRRKSPAPLGSRYSHAHHHRHQPPLHHHHHHHHHQSICLQCRQRR